MRRSRLVSMQVICLLCMTFATIGTGGYYYILPAWGRWGERERVFNPGNENGPGAQNTKPSFKIEDAAVKKEGKPELYEIAPSHVAAILDPSSVITSRLECPVPPLARYEYLRVKESLQRDENLRYFFALDLRQSFMVLPRLLSSIIEAVRFLGPSACALSITEGNSDDGTFEVLELLRPELRKMGLRYFFRSSDVDPVQGERIVKLAELRNLALEPLVSKSIELGADRDTTVVFLNDVVICMEDILELVHQRVFQSADMTCAMDWTYVGINPTFYDVWVARTLTGETFFDIPLDGSWDWAWNLFWKDLSSKQRFNNKWPFQVFACWNGAVAFTAAPVLGLPRAIDGPLDSNEKSRIVAFRAPLEGECFGGEPTLFCKDLWRAGYGRIAVVPSVNLEYSDEAGRHIKAEKGYVSQWTGKENIEDTKIAWVDAPPDEIKCMPVWKNQYWEPWNKTLP